MDPLAAKGTEVLLSSVLRQHRFPVGFPASARGLREVVRRHTSPVTIKFLSYNTFLTELRVSLPDPFPDLHIAPKPALHRRAAEIGRRVFSEYDFAALYEVMQDKQEVLVITPQSPLGAQLMEKKQGDRPQLLLAGKKQPANIVSVE